MIFNPDVSKYGQEIVTLTKKVLKLSIWVSIWKIALVNPTLVNRHVQMISNIIYILKSMWHMYYRKEIKAIAFIQAFHPFLPRVSFLTLRKSIGRPLL